MILRDYLLSSGVVVKLSGKVLTFTEVPDELAELDMGNKLAVRTPQGLVTVASLDPKRPYRFPPSDHDIALQREFDSSRRPPMTNRHSVRSWRT